MKEHMAFDAIEPMLVTVRVIHGQLAETLARVWNEFEVVSVVQENKDDLYLNAMDGKQIASSIIRQIDELIADPPHTDFQRGYLEALVALYREGLGLNRGQTDARIEAAERLIADRFVFQTPHPPSA